MWHHPFNGQTASPSFLPPYPNASLPLQLEEHNSQIKELQAAWEAAKLEEESRGGGAADVKRWNGLRTAMEARELLRTLFRIACDHKWGEALCGS